MSDYIAVSCVLVNSAVVQPFAWRLLHRAVVKKKLLYPIDVSFWGGDTAPSQTHSH